METEDLRIETAPEPADVAFLDDQINAYNIATTGFDDARLLAIIVRDTSGSIVAGTYGWTWGGCCEIRSLWVAETLRGHGYGSRLLAAAEREAATRGCAQVILDTHEFQAPLFYQRHGYEIVGDVDNYPRGYRKYYLRKVLSPPVMAPNMQTTTPTLQGESRMSNLEQHVKETHDTLEAAQTSVEAARRAYEQSGSEAAANFLRDAQEAYDEALAAYEVARNAHER